jgi:hypothetical protein
VNGKSIGRHLGGYTGFSFDVTGAVATGDNVVAVQLNNSWNAQLAPRGGDHQFSGGIYRDVNLVVTDPLHVTWYGTFVTTPTISATSATVNIKTELRNDYATDKNCTLKTDIVDAKGATVATVSSTQVVAANSTVTVDQTTPAIANPSLWHPDHPTLYRAVSTVSEGAINRDSFLHHIWLPLDQLERHHRLFYQRRALLLSRRECPSGPCGLVRWRDQCRALSRREDGQGRWIQLHPRLALSERPGLCRCLRPARGSVVVGKQLLGLWRRDRRRRLEDGWLLSQQRR